MIDTSILEKVINNCSECELIDLRNEFEKLLDAIDTRLNESSDSKIKRFIKLYDTARARLNYLIDRQTTIDSNIYAIFWTELFNKGGYRDESQKLFPFDYYIIDSSYEDEVNQYMSAWDYEYDKAKEIIKEQNDDNTTDIY